MRRLSYYCNRTVYALHVISFLPVGKEYAAQIISSRNKNKLYATHKIFFRSMSIDFATQIFFYWVEKITFATQIRFFLIGRYRYATRIVIFHSGRLWFASGFYLCGARGLEILADMIYAEALGLKNRPKTGIPDGRGLEYLIRMAWDETRGRVVLIRMGFSDMLGRWKLGTFFFCLFLLFLSWLGERRQKKVKPPQGAFSLFAGGRGRVDLVGMGFSESLGRWKLGTFFFCLFLLFLSWHKKRRQKKVKPPQGAFSLSVGGRGRVDLTGIGFSESWGRWKLRAFFLYFFLLFLSWLGERRQKKVKPSQGAFSLFVGRRGRGILARIGFFYLLGRWKLKVLSIDIFTR